MKKALLFCLFIVIGFSSAQTGFEGIYSLDENTRIEIKSMGDHFEGLFVIEGASYRFWAEASNKTLAGRIYTAEVGGYENDMYFEAVLEPEGLLFSAVPFEIDGSIDEQKVSSIVLKRQANAGSSPGKIAGSNPPVVNNPSNPIAETNPSNSKSFVGKYKQDDVELVIQVNGSSYQGEIAFPGKRLSMLAELNAGSLVGKFFANNEEIPFTARLDPLGIIVTITNEDYNLVRVNSGLTTNPLTRSGQNGSTQPIAENPNPSASNSESVQSGRAYSSGDVVYSPWTGVSFIVPSGFRATFEQETGFFVLFADNSQAVYLVQAASQASAWSMASLAVGYLRGVAESEVQLLTDPIETPNSLKVSISGDDIVMHIESKSGWNSNAVVVMATAVDARALTSFVSSISLSAPQPQNNNLALGGLALFRDSTDPNRGGGFYSKKEETESYLICSDGSYAYEYYSSEDVLMGSFSDTFTENDAHDGNWHPVSNIIGETMLLLEATDGRVLIYSASQSANGIAINNKEFRVLQSGQCN